MSTISGFCEKCNGFRKRYCDGDRNTCMSILFDTIEALQQVNERLKATIDEIKGIVGYPGEEALKKHGLTDTLPNIVRYLHREWLEQTHKAGQRCIEKDIEIDKLKDENEQLRAQVARMREALEKAREALDYWRELYLEVLNGDTEPFDSFYDNSGTYEALAEIDKAIGGKEDVTSMGD